MQFFTIKINVAFLKKTVSPEAPFFWKLLYIGLRSVKDLRKNVPNFEVCDTPIAPPTTLSTLVVFVVIN